MAGKSEPKLLQDNNTRLRLAGFDSLFSSAERGVLLLDGNGVIAQANSVAHTLLDLDENSRNLYDVFKQFSSNSGEFVQRILHAIISREDLEMESYCQEKQKWLRVRYLCFDGGSVCFISDITQLRQQQTYIEELARFPEETWNPVMKFSVDGTIVYTNSRCDAILQTWGTGLNQSLPDYVTAVVQHSIQTNTAQEVEIECNSGQIFSILLAPVPEANATYVYGRDVTQLKENEKELLAHRDHLEDLVSQRTRAMEVSRDEAERASKAKSIFLANMSHEIRTPLAAIIGFAESLLDEQDEASRQHSVETIIRSGNHLKNIVNNILDLSKIEAEKIELEALEVSIFEVLADLFSIINSQANAKGVGFEIEYLYPLPTTLMTDPVRLKQILINLCNNAIKFTEQGKVFIAVSCDAKSHRMTFEVIDTGIGMNSEQLLKVFQPFAQADSSTTRRFGGTGLGLTLSKQFAQLLGGDLSASSVEGEGSVFTLEIDTGDLSAVEFTENASHVRQEVFSAAVQQQPLQGRVLLAEDTPELQELSSYLLKRMGLEVVLAENGAVAVEKAIQSEFDVVILDMQMPVLDGYGAARKLRSQGYKGAIVAMTANTMKQDRDRALDSGCDAFVGKPISRNELYQVLLNYLDPADDIAPMELVSSLLQDEPELADLVAKFVEKLPALIVRIRNLHQNNDVEELKKEIHVLKALGGGHGFVAISEVAQKMEEALRREQLSALNSLLQQLDQLLLQAQAGLQN